MQKKTIFLFSALMLAMVLAVPGNIKAQTAADIQSQINQLLAQVTQLENQLSQLNGQQYPYYQNYQGSYQGVPAGFTFAQDLYLGTVSQDVVYLRSVLIQDGCLDPSYGTSQYFDSTVQSAVMCFQNKHNPDIYALLGYHVYVSGNVGPGTRAELNNLIGNNYVYNNGYNYQTNYNYPAYSSALSVSCYASPNSISINQPVNFTASATGGAGYYTYTWSGACIGSGSTCSTPAFTNMGNYTAYVTVTSGGQSASANCPISVANNYGYNYNNYLGNLTASCYASSSSVQTGQAGNFTGTASGGNGIYSYLWSGACSGGTSNCYNIFSNPGNYTAYLTVTSNGQTASASCPISVGGYSYNNNISGISCLATPSTARVGQPVTFTVALPVGTNAYSYSWTGSCTGSGQVCYNTFPTTGSYNTTVTVYANGQTGTANCSAYVNSY